MTETHLWPERKLAEDGSLELSAIVEFAGGGQRERLWYRIPPGWSSSVPDSTDPLVVGSLFLLMKLGRDVRVHGDVSPSLISSLEEFQSAWSIWKPARYRKVRLLADREVEAGPRSSERAAISAFSGGVDSAFTAYRHVRGSDVHQPMPLRACVMVHGFDIPLEEPAVFSRARAKAAGQLQSLGVELIPVVTNYRSLDVDWTDAFGSAVVATLRLFQGKFDTGLIAQGVPYHCYHHIVEGSNPLTDPLLSSASFRVVADGAAFRRIDKIEAMRSWKEGLEGIRVCWQGPEKDRNCCRCEKCIRNILTFRALGLGLPRCFESDVTDEQIRGLRRLKEITISVGYDAIVERVARTGERPPWIGAVCAAIRSSRRHRLLQYVTPRRLAGAVVRPLRRLFRSGAPRKA